MVEVVGRCGDGSPEFRKTYSEIQSRWFSSIWAIGDQANLSMRCAKKRETSQCRKERKGRQVLIGSIEVCRR
jgi:hypothetical protein